MLITQQGQLEDEEKAKDFIAMHAFQNKNGLTKILDHVNPLVHSVFTNE